MARQRLGWVDLAKVVSICLVTSYHTIPPLTGYASQVVQLLRMPAFFLIAGYLFNDTKFPSLAALLKHRARQLLIPYFCFEALFIPLTCRSWAEASDAMVNALLGHPVVCFPLWFLVCLFFLQVIHYLCIRITERLTRGSWRPYRYQLLGMYVIVSTLLSPFDLPMHFQLNAIAVNLPFYAVANCGKEWINRIEWQHYKMTAACLVDGLLLVWAKGFYPSSYLMHLCAGLLMLPPYIATCKVIGRYTQRLSIVEYLGSNTVVILALHTYFILAITKGLDHVFGDGFLMEHGWLNPWIALGVVIMHYPIIRAINAWMPWMLGRAHRTDGQ